VKLDERDLAVRPTGDFRRDGFNPTIDRHGYQATEQDWTESVLNEAVHKARTAQDTVRETVLMQLNFIEYTKLLAVSSSTQVDFMVKCLLLTAFVEPWGRKAQLSVESFVSDWCEDGT